MLFCKSPPFVSADFWLLIPYCAQNRSWNNLIEGSLQIDRLLLSDDQAHRRELTSFLDLASGVVLWGSSMVFLLYQFPCGSQSVHSCAAEPFAGSHLNRNNNVVVGSASALYAQSSIAVFPLRIGLQAAVIGQK
jgi:hypothetical protein